MSKLYYYIKNIIESYSLNNLLLNLIKPTSGEIYKTDYMSKHTFFQKRATNIYMQQCFHSYINREENKNIFTEVKYLYT